jgi:prophage regulatory protein
MRLSAILGPRGPIPVSRSAWWNGVRTGRFPKPVKLGPRTTAWRAQDILALIERVEVAAMRGEPLSWADRRRRDHDQDQGQNRDQEQDDRDYVRRRHRYYRDRYHRDRDHDRDQVRDQDDRDYERDHNQDHDHDRDHDRGQDPDQ